MSSSVQGSSRTIVTKNLHKVFAKTKSGYFYNNECHTQVNFECLDKMYSNQLLCDVILKSEGMEIQAHKVILATCSAYFYYKFSSDRNLGTLNCITIQNVNYETLSAVVGYFYKSQVLITAENVKDLLGAAYLLAVPDLQEACRDFLKTNLTPERCLGAVKIAIKYHCEDLLPLLDDFVVDNFIKVIKYDDFLELSYDEILNLISRGLPRILAEDVLDSIIRWISFDLAHRKQYIHSLSDYVKFSSISLDRIVQIIEEQHWLQNEPQFMFKCMKFRNLEKPLTPPACRRQQSTLLVVVGVCLSQCLNMEVYDLEKKSWLPGPEVVNKRCEWCAKVAIHGTTIYCLEWDQMTSIDIGRNAAQMVWSKCDRMMEGIFDTYSIVASNSNIYAVEGHYLGARLIATANKYDTNSGKWNSIANLSHARRDVGLGALNGYLYAVGGSCDNFTSFCRTCWINPAERYNVDRNCWQTMPAMSIKRSYPGVGALEDRLFVVGGSSRAGSCRQVEVFDPVESSWSRLPDMNVARQAPGVIGVDGQLYVIGGRNSSVLFNSVEIYDPKSNTWSMLPNEMNVSKDFVAAALIDKSLIKFLD